MRLAKRQENYKHCRNTRQSSCVTARGVPPAPPRLKVHLRVDFRCQRKKKVPPPQKKKYFGKFFPGPGPGWCHLPPPPPSRPQNRTCHRTSEPDQPFPPPPPPWTDKLKTLPSRHTPYAGGNEGWLCILTINVHFIQELLLCYRVKSVGSGSGHSGDDVRQCTE